MSDSTISKAVRLIGLITVVAGLISFGVAALAIGLGVLFALLGFALIKLSGPAVDTAGSAKRVRSGDAVGATA